MNHYQLLYVDPGTGYLLAQIVTGVAGAFIVLRERILGFFKKDEGGNDTR
jgi:hypothetical protein